MAVCEWFCLERTGLSQGENKSHGFAASHSDTMFHTCSSSIFSCVTCVSLLIIFH